MNKTISHIVHLNVDSDPKFISEEMLSEIENLVINLDIVIKKKEIIKIKRINPSTLIGEGNLVKIDSDIKRNNINLLVVNNNLTPAQQKNLENRLKIKVTDRTGIILEVFARRAKSNEGKMQVQLAELIYRKSRLVRAWTHLERQRGGTTFIGGPGELQIELDRRLIQEKILNIKKRLSKVKRRRHVQRNLRKNNNFKTAALIGYTNAGKSTLFNAITNAHVFAADQLFATLDPTMRRVSLHDLGSVIFADTVGFISHLPHRLVDAFRATLEEASSADLLLHIIDASSEDRSTNILRVNDVLKEINAFHLPTLLVYNKIDLMDGSSSRIERDSDGNPVAVWVSALTGEGLDLVRSALVEKLPNKLLHVHLKLTPSHGALRATLYRHNAVIKEVIDNEGQIEIEIKLPESELFRILKNSGLKFEDLVTIS